jgi:hypothetical protein
MKGMKGMEKNPDPKFQISFFLWSLDLGLWASSIIPLIPFIPVKIAFTAF